MAWSRNPTVAGLVAATTGVLLPLAFLGGRESVTGETTTATVTVATTQTVTVTRTETGATSDAPAAEATYLSDLVGDLEDVTTSDAVSVEARASAKIGAREYPNSLVARIYSPLADPSEVAFELPVAGHTRLTGTAGFGFGSPSEAAATLLIYRDQARGDPFARYTFEGPHREHQLNVEIADTTTLIMRFVPYGDRERLPNGTDFVFGSAAVE